MVCCFVGMTLFSPMALGCLTNKTTLDWCQHTVPTPLQFGLEMWAMIHSPECSCIGGLDDGWREICGSLPTEEFIEFFMWQTPNFCRSGPVLVLISVQQCWRAVVCGEIPPVLSLGVSFVFGRFEWTFHTSQIPLFHRAECLLCFTEGASSCSSFSCVWGGA